MRKRTKFRTGDAVIVLGFAKSVQAVTEMLMSESVTEVGAAFYGVVQNNEPAPDVLVIGNGDSADILAGNPAMPTSVALFQAFKRDAMLVRVAEGCDEDGLSTFLILRSSKSDIENLRHRTDITAAGLRIATKLIKEGKEKAN